MFTYKIDHYLSLKLLEPQDAQALFELTDKSRSHLKEWLPWLDFTTKVSDTEEFIAGTMKGYANRSSLSAAILYQGEVVGTAGFNNINWSNKTAYIGYWLGEGNQGKGIMTRVVSTLTTYAFEHYALNKVEIRAAVGNQKSRGIPERLGYIEEGTIRQAEWLYDRYVDHVIYGILADEWKEKSE